MTCPRCGGGCSIICCALCKDKRTVPNSLGRLYLRKKDPDLSDTLELVKKYNKRRNV